ncbi:MAG: nucleotidyltransferase domain-containing protein [Candidatus Omnitrophota bacterium]
MQFEGITKIAQDFSLSAVILFGSRLPEKTRFKNDYDFAVLIPTQKLEVDKELSLICKFSQLLKTDNFDLVVLNFASPLLQYEVARGGKVIYERKPGLFNRFRWHAIQRWNDNKKFHALKTKYINEYLKGNG